MRNLTGIFGVGIVALDQRNRMAETAELNKAEIDGKDGGGDDKPANDQWKGRTADGHGIEHGAGNHI